MRELVVTIPGRPPTPNARRHWRKIATDNAIWKEKAFDAAIAAGVAAGWRTVDQWIKVATIGKREVKRPFVLAEPMQYAEVEVVIVVPDERDRDFDNGVASVKPLMDACRIAGVIVDDSIRRLPDRRYGFVHAAHISRVQIRFREVDPPGSLGL